MGTYLKCLVEALLMSTPNIGFRGEIRTISILFVEKKQNNNNKKTTTKKQPLHLEVCQAFDDEVISGLAEVSEAEKPESVLFFQ